MALEFNSDTNPKLAQQCTYHKIGMLLISALNSIFLYDPQNLYQSYIHNLKPKNYNYIKLIGKLRGTRHKTKQIRKYSQT